MLKLKRRFKITLKKASVKWTAAKLQVIDVDGDTDGVSEKINCKNEVQSVEVCTPATLSNNAKEYDKEG